MWHEAVVTSGSSETIIVKHSSGHSHMHVRNKLAENNLNYGHTINYDNLMFYIYS